MSKKPKFKKYFRTPDRRPIGVMLAEEVDGELHFGWAVETRKQLWDRLEGDAYARARLETCTVDFLDHRTPNPSSVYNFSVPANKLKGSNSLAAQADFFINKCREVITRNSAIESEALAGE